MRGNTDWTPQRLTWVGAFMGWDEGQTLGTRWDHACDVAHQIHPHWKLGTSYAGFAQALVRQTPTLVEAVTRRFQRQMQACGDASGEAGPLDGLGRRRQPPRGPPYRGQ